MEIKINTDFQDFLEKLRGIGRLVIVMSHLFNISDKSEKIEKVKWNRTSIKKLTIDRLPKYDGNCYEIILKDGKAWFNIYEHGEYNNDYTLFCFINGELHCETKHGSIEDALCAAVKFHNQIKK